MMEKMINLPNMDAIHEFVQHARETGDMVLVTKDGFKVQLDGASVLGMMSVIGQNIRVKCFGNADPLRHIFEQYRVIG